MLRRRRIHHIHGIPSRTTRRSRIRQTCIPAPVTPVRRHRVLRVQRLGEPSGLDHGTLRSAVRSVSGVTDGAERRRLQKPAADGFVQSLPCVRGWPVGATWDRLAFGGVCLSSMAEVCRLDDDGLAAGREEKEGAEPRGAHNVARWSGSPVPVCQCCMSSLAGWFKAGILRRQVGRYMSGVDYDGWAGYFLACRGTMPGRGIVQHLVRHSCAQKPAGTVQSRRAHAIKATPRMPNPRGRKTTILDQLATFHSNKCYVFIFEPHLTRTLFIVQLTINNTVFQPLQKAATHPPPPSSRSPV